MGEKIANHIRVDQQVQMQNDIFELSQLGAGAVRGQHAAPGASGAWSPG
jgi:hypothetical protein